MLVDVTVLLSMAALGGCVYLGVRLEALTLLLRTETDSRVKELNEAIAQIENLFTQNEQGIAELRESYLESQSVPVKFDKDAQISQEDDWFRRVKRV